jgi:hypothetical protein
VRGTREISTLAQGMSGGSRLHRGTDGWMIAYARWPDRATRDRVFASPSPAAREAIADMQVCVAERAEEEWLEITDDILTPEAGLGPAFRPKP